MSTELVELLLDSAYTNEASVPGETSSDRPLFRLNNSIQNVVGVKVLEASIPFTYYTIPEGNAPPPNNLPWGRIGFKWGSSNAVEMTIPAGTYSVASMTSTLLSLMASQHSNMTSFPDSFFTAPITESVTFSQTTGKFSLVYTSSAAVVEGIVPVPVTTCGWYGGNSLINEMLGITGPLPAITSGVVSGGGTIFTTTFGIAHLNGRIPIYINSNKLGPLLKVYMPQGPYITGSQNPQIAVVPVNGNFGDILNWSNHDGDWLDAQNLFNLENLDLYLTTGTNPASLKLNGFSFIVRLGLLITTAGAFFSKGSYENDRKRVKLVG